MNSVRRYVTHDPYTAMF